MVGITEAGVDEVDVHRIIRRMRLGLRAVVRAATNTGGDAGDKTPPGPVKRLCRAAPQLLFASFAGPAQEHSLSREFGSGTSTEGALCAGSLVTLARSSGASRS